MLDMKIQELDPVRVAAVRHVGPFTELKDAFMRVCGWAGQKQLFGPNTRVMGVFHDDPKTVAAGELRSDAAITVPEAVEADPDAGVAIAEVAGGDYAVGILKGPYEGLHAAYDWIYQQWLPTSGRTPRHAPSYEVYLNDASSTPASDLLTAIHIPLEAE